MKTLGVDSRYSSYHRLKAWTSHFYTKLLLSLFLIYVYSKILLFYFSSTSEQTLRVPTPTNFQINSLPREENILNHVPTDLPSLILPDFSISHILSSCDNTVDPHFLQDSLTARVLDQLCSNDRYSLEELICGLHCDAREPELERSMRILNLEKYNYELLYHQCKHLKLFSVLVRIHENIPTFMACGDRIKGSQLWVQTQRVLANVLCLVHVPDVVFGFDTSDWAVPVSVGEVPGWNQPLPGVVRYVGTDSQPSVLFPTGQFVKATTHCEIAQGSKSSWTKVCNFDDDPKPFQLKTSQVHWRGSSTGVPMQQFYLDYLPRPALLKRFLHEPGFDVGFIGGHPPSKSKEYLRFFDSASKAFVPAREFQNFKYLLHMDGHTSSWGLAQKLGFTKSAVLWVKSSFTYREFYYDLLRPWEHFIPVQNDLSDLLPLKEYFFNHEDIGEDVALRAFKLFRTRLRPEATYCYLLRLLYSLALHLDSDSLLNVNPSDFEVFPDFELLRSP